MPPPPRPPPKEPLLPLECPLKDPPRAIEDELKTRGGDALKDLSLKEGELEVLLIAAGGLEVLPIEAGELKALLIELGGVILCPLGRPAGATRFWPTLGIVRALDWTMGGVLKPCGEVTRLLAMPLRRVLLTGSTTDTLFPNPLPTWLLTTKGW